MQSAGPGFSQVFMRGIATGVERQPLGPSRASASTWTSSRSRRSRARSTIHIYDIERVEVLAGPQGTLYGASSQAGTIRTITNKPDPKAFSAVTTSRAISSNRRHGYTAEGYLNIPMDDSIAVRLVGWYEHSPGYIDNVNGEMNFPIWRERTMTDTTGRGLHQRQQRYVKENYNDGDTYGGRALLKIDLNDSWSIMPGMMGQQTQYNGLPVYDPNIGDLKISHFNPEKSDDNWFQASLTVEGTHRQLGNRVRRRLPRPQRLRRVRLLGLLVLVRRAVRLGATTSGTTPAT